MRQGMGMDPLLMEVYHRQHELLEEAAYDRLAAQARGRLDSSGRPIVRKKLPQVSLWRRTAWSLGRTAFSVGTWLMAR